MNSRYLHKLRSIIFSPESKFELWTRTIYHKLAATRIFFWIQDRIAKKSYRRWLAQQKKDIESMPNTFLYQPRITFLVNASDGSQKQLSQTLDSIFTLQGKNLEVLVSLTESQEFLDLPNNRFPHSNLKIITRNDDVPKKITGDYIVFCQPGDHFLKSTLNVFYQQINKDNPADVFYYDCESKDGSHKQSKAFFKPNSLSPSLLLSINYLSRAFIKVATLKQYSVPIYIDNDLLSEEFNILLRLYEAGAVFQHIPSVLVSQIRFASAEMPSIMGVAKKYLLRQELKTVTAHATTYGTRFIWENHLPAVDIIILTKNHFQMLKKLINSIYSFDYQQDIKVKIVDNGSDDHSTLAYYEKIKKTQEIELIPYNKTFNYSEAINLGVSYSDSELILFLNDDMQVINSDWLSELSQWALRPEIGVVGAKLIRANQMIQHAGIIMGLTGFVGHIYLNAPEHYFGLWGSVDWYRDIIAVTGACQMMRREIFQEVGGYDEKFQLAFGDIDFCCRVAESGYRNVYTPFAQLLHYEGSTRGYVTPVPDTLRGYEKLALYLNNEDPYFSTNLTYTRIPKCQIGGFEKDERTAMIRERKKFYERIENEK